MKRYLSALAASVLLASCQTAPPPETPTVPKKLTVIVINDTYRLDNLPYVRSLRKEIEKTEGQVLVVHAGDFLFPSLISQEFDGKQMIDMLNRLDGNANAADPRFFITFGNHEFDKDKLENAALVTSRIAESQFDWLGSNIHFKQDSNGQPLVSGKNLVDTSLITVNDVTVGLIGATIDVKHPAYVDHFESPVETLKRASSQLRSQGADVVVAVTHLKLSQDKALLDALGNEGPDFIAGGHEHDRKNEIVNGRRVVKADSDATSAAVVRIATGQSPMSTEVQFIDLPGKYTPDTDMQNRFAFWDHEFGKVKCAKTNEQPDCMKRVYGKANVDLIGEELTIRRYETNLGNFLADTARDAFAKQGAQIAFLNSGGMRLNYNIPVGDVTRMQIDTLFAYETKISLIEITGKDLQEVVNHAITDWTGNGRWLQISGFAFRHDPEKQTAEGLSLITPTGLRPIKPDDKLLAVTNNYLISNNSDHDGFYMLNESLRVDEKLEQPDLKKLVIDKLQKAGSSGIAPKVQGRICNIQKAPACQCMP